MPNVININFNNAPPAQGGRRYDLVPEGTYLLEITETSQGLARSGSGRTVVGFGFRICEGESVGKKVGQTFTMPLDGNDSVFGIQQIHALILAVSKKATKPLEGGKKIDLDKLVGKQVVSEIQIETLKATEERREVQISRPVSFYRVGSDEAENKIEESTKANVDGAAADEAEATEAIVAEPETDAETPESEVPVAAEEPNADSIDDLFD